jgi:hypothetical protein
MAANHSLYTAADSHAPVVGNQKNKIDHMNKEQVQKILISTINGLANNSVDGSKRLVYNVHASGPLMVWQTTALMDG